MFLDMRALVLIVAKYKPPKVCFLLLLVYSQIYAFLDNGVY